MDVHCRASAVSLKDVLENYVGATNPYQFLFTYKDFMEKTNLLMETKLQVPELSFTFDKSEMTDVGTLKADINIEEMLWPEMAEMLSRYMVTKKLATVPLFSLADHGQKSIAGATAMTDNLSAPSCNNMFDDSIATLASSPVPDDVASEFCMSEHIPMPDKHTQVVTRLQTTERLTEAGSSRARGGMAVSDLDPELVAIGRKGYITAQSLRPPSPPQLSSCTCCVSGRKVSDYIQDSRDGNHYSRKAIWFPSKEKIEGGSDAVYLDGDTVVVACSGNKKSKSVCSPGLLVGPILNLV